jgi:hypothetical protein
MFVNEKLMLTPSVSAGTTWESSDKEVASINENGVVVGLKKGSTTITAKSAKGESAVCEIKVIDAADFFTPADITKLTLKKSEIDKKNSEIMDKYDHRVITLAFNDRQVLYDRIDAVAQNGGAVTITNVVELVDRAIHNANKFFRKLGSQKKRYDSLDRIILREKDFR